MLLLAAALIATGDVIDRGTYTQPALELTVLGCIVLFVATVVPLPEVPVTVETVAIGVLGAWSLLALAGPAMFYDQGSATTAVRCIAVGLPMLAAASLVTRGSASSWFWHASLFTFSIGALVTVLGERRPYIDVWYFVTHGASCVHHACNPYAMFTPAAPGLQHGFPYLPFTFLSLAPFDALGDVRYGEALAILLAALAVRRLDGRGAALAPVLLCVPGIFMQIEMAWTESLLVMLLVAAALLAARTLDRQPHAWLVPVFLGLALSTKQHVWLLVPIMFISLGRRIALQAVGVGCAVIIPWALAGPHVFFRDTVFDFVALPPRPDALTMWLHEPSLLRTAGAVAALALAYVVAWLVCRGDPTRFVLGAALVAAAFDLMNKQSFFNQWLLVTWMTVAAAAFELSRRPHTAQDSAVRSAG